MNTSRRSIASESVAIPLAWWVRIGCLGDMVPARAAPESGPHESGLTDLASGTQVLVRTSRGVEIGVVVGERVNSAASDNSTRSFVRILRRTTENDRRLIQRLDLHKVDAIDACRTAILDAGCDAVLLDVDHLFDGGTLLLHFLGKTPADIDVITAKVVSRYESIVRTQEFAELINTGCGPDCGTKDGGGCGTGCAGCAVAGACAAKGQ